MNRSWQCPGAIKRLLSHFTWEYCILQLEILPSSQTRFRLLILTPIPWPTWHFVLICKPVKQKWERRLNKCSVLKCLWVGKAFWRDNNNQILSIFISLISLPLGWRASQFLCCCPGFLFTAKGIYIHVRVSRSISCYRVFYSDGYFFYRGHQSIMTPLVCRDKAITETHVMLACGNNTTFYKRSCSWKLHACFSSEQASQKQFVWLEILIRPKETTAG